MEQELQEIEKIPTPIIEETSDPIVEAAKAMDLGVTNSEISAMVEYIKGKADRPEFLEKFLTDPEGRIKDFSYIMNLIQLARIPSLTALLGSVNARLYSEENLREMDIKQLSAASSNLSKEINGIQETSRRTIDALQQTSTPDSSYRQLLDIMLNQDPEQIEILKTVVNPENTVINDLFKKVKDMPEDKVKELLNNIESK